MMFLSGSYDFNWLWIPILLLIIAGGIIFVWKGLRVKCKTFGDNDLINAEEIADEFDAFETGASKEFSVASYKIAPSVELDIFYRFIKNKFFMLLIQELKIAAENKDSTEMVQCMNEIEKYQKNFRRSFVIVTMSELVNKNGFDELLQLLEKEIKQG
jgi:hypothetical protein